MSDSVRSEWRIHPGASVRLHDHDASSRARAPGNRAATELCTASLSKVMGSLQERLWAEGSRSLLVVLQGIDASGKDGTVSHVFRGLNPQGTRVSNFKVPSPEELRHDFLWRIHPHVPAAGEIAIFNRSHYEDVIVPQVHATVAAKVWHARYDDIAAFEELLTRAGTTIIKIFLHVSKAEQLERLEERLADPQKRWKIGDADFAERARWDRYRDAFERMLSTSSTEHAPWYVIPADRKWYRNWAVATIVTETLVAMDPHFPTQR